MGRLSWKLPNEPYQSMAGWTPTFPVTDKATLLASNAKPFAKKEHKEGNLLRTNKNFYIQPKLSTAQDT